MFVQSVSALTISPVKMEMYGDPGQTLRGELILFNEQDETKTFYSSSENFEARGEIGTPFFLPEKVGLATWIKTQEQVTLKPKKTKTIPFSIQIPKNAESGGHFAAILWGTTPTQATQGGQVAVGGKLGVLVLLKVSGETKEGGGLLEFGGEDKQKFFSSLPIIMAYRFNNTGGDRVVPTGEIQINNIFGFISATLSANKNNGNVLPGSARKFEVIWEQTQKDAAQEPFFGGTDATGFFEIAGRQWKEFHFGWYTAHLNLIWAGQTATEKYGFFIIPWQLILIIFITFVIVGFLGRMGLKRYNRWIIAQARR